MNSIESNNSATLRNAREQCAKMHKSAVFSIKNAFQITN